MVLVKFEQDRVVVGSFSAVRPLRILALSHGIAHGHKAPVQRLCRAQQRIRLYPAEIFPGLEHRGLPPRAVSCAGKGFTGDLFFVDFWDDGGSFPVSGAVLILFLVILFLIILSGTRDALRGIFISPGNSADSFLLSGAVFILVILSGIGDDLPGIFLSPGDGSGSFLLSGAVFLFEILPGIRDDLPGIFGSAVDVVPELFPGLRICFRRGFHIGCDDPLARQDYPAIDKGPGKQCVIRDLVQAYIDRILGKFRVQRISDLLAIRRCVGLEAFRDPVVVHFTRGSAGSVFRVNGRD